MPCNAWNHPPGCNCGWGGVNYGAGISRWEFEAADAYEREQRVAAALRSFITPNARCPVCGAHVWFYQAPNGGRAFFDDIGWPWPKHPCTDHSSGVSSRGSLPARDAEAHRADEPRLLAWQANGDRPILRVLSEGRIPSVDIFKSTSQAVVEIANPIELVTITWPTVSEIEWDLPAFLRETAEELAELHTLRWTGSTFDGRVIEVTISR